MLDSHLQPGNDRIARETGDSRQCVQVVAAHSMHSEAPSKLDWTPITLHVQKTNDKYTDTHAKPLLNEQRCQSRRHRCAEPTRVARDGEQAADGVVSIRLSQSAFLHHKARTIKTPTLLGPRNTGGAPDSMPREKPPPALSIKHGRLTRGHAFYEVNHESDAGSGSSAGTR